MENWQETDRDVASQGIVVSPCGKYELVVDYFKPGGYTYSRGMVYRKSDGLLFATIHAQKAFLYWDFFQSNGFGVHRHPSTPKGRPLQGSDQSPSPRETWNGVDWLYCSGRRLSDEPTQEDLDWLKHGHSQLSRCFVNLDTGEVYNDNGRDGFKWYSITANPHVGYGDRCILAVDGTFYEYQELQFFDFTDPANIRLIPFADDTRHDKYPLTTDGCNPYTVTWTDSTHCEYVHYQNYVNKYEKFMEDLVGDEFLEMYKEEDDSDYDESDYTRVFSYKCVLYIDKATDYELLSRKDECASDMIVRIESTHASDKYSQRLRDNEEWERKRVEIAKAIRENHPVYLALQHICDENEGLSLESLHYFGYINRMFVDDICQQHFGSYIRKGKDFHEFRYIPHSVDAEEKYLLCGERLAFDTLDDLVAYIQDPQPTTRSKGRNYDWQGGLICPADLQ